MRSRSQCLLASAIAVLLFAAPASSQQSAGQSTEIDNVAAFARLYGVARWFYPSDAAAAIPWNRFAIDGVRRVRTARTPQELETTLKQIFTPLGPGIEIGASLPPKRATGSRNADLIGWHYHGVGFSDLQSAYSAKRTNRSVTAPRGAQAPFSVVVQTIAADTLRGRTVRMRGQMRVTSPNTQGSGGMWLRVDRVSQAMGFFDNMQDRPVRDTAWREYVIEGKIAPDATQIVFGALNTGTGSVDVDAIELSVRTDGGNWTPLVVRDAGFEATGNVASQGWTQNPTLSIERIATGAAQGKQFTRIRSGASDAPGSTASTAPSDSLETPITGASVDFTLTRGLQARVPLSLTDAEARTESPQLAGLRAAVESVSNIAGSDEVNVRLADVVVGWSALRHFYPYWGDIDVNWDARLRPQLESALNAAATRVAHLDDVRLLVADLNDGHGSVTDVAIPSRMSSLPVLFRILGDRLVVTGSGAAAIPVGSVVKAIDGVPASTVVREEMRLASGTAQWKRTRAENGLRMCPILTSVALSIEAPDGATRAVSLPCGGEASRFSDGRPDNAITKLQSGIWYVDLTRVQATQLTPMLDSLSKAPGVVFDMRGYPTDAGAMILPHLMRSAEDSTDRWMHVPRFARPFGEVAGWDDYSWYLKPATPHINGQRVFLTDGRAISYAESVMGYIRDYKLGTIIGGTTAGANGNVASFGIPGGFTIRFTGMRVTRHDSKTAYHTAGVAPDIPLEPTLEGIRAGRDELLLRALQTLRIVP